MADGQNKYYFFFLQTIIYSFMFFFIFLNNEHKKYKKYFKRRRRIIVTFFLNIYKHLIFILPCCMENFCRKRSEIKIVDMQQKFEHESGKKKFIWKLKNIGF
jgi:hypothetical protein